MRILGIEASCDDTSVAVVQSDGTILSLLSNCQSALHAPYGGVVPQTAARAHLEALPDLLVATFQKVPKETLDGIAATCGPGLIGGLVVGVMAGKGVAKGLNKPFWAIHHLEAHGLTPRLQRTLPFPYLLLLLSGGHTQSVLFSKVGCYHLLGTTWDDAVGEVFDKVGRFLHLSYPGGPEIERLAQQGDPQRFAFPRPLWKHPSCNFSFSGLKSCLRRLIDQQAQSLFPSDNISVKEPFNTQWVSDVCASFQWVIAESLKERLAKAWHHARKIHPELTNVVLSGGVAANTFLYTTLKHAVTQWGGTLIRPDPLLCTDNGAMIAWAALERVKAGNPPADWGAQPRALWSWEQLSSNT